MCAWQMISLISSTSRAANFPPTSEYSCTTLIVCPLSVITNWQSQIRTHVKLLKLSVCTYHGPERHAHDDLDQYVHSL